MLRIWPVFMALAILSGLTYEDLLETPVREVERRIRLRFAS